MADSCENGPLNRPCGTPYYIAPEILKQRPYTTQVDMWSVGVILYIMLCGYLPFDYDDDQLLYKKIKWAQYEMTSDEWNNVSDKCKDCIKRLLIPYPAKRHTADKILKHEWLRPKNKKRKVTKKCNKPLKLSKYDDTVDDLKIINQLIVEEQSKPKKTKSNTTKTSKMNARSNSNKISFQTNTTKPKPKRRNSSKIWRSNTTKTPTPNDPRNK